MRTKILNKFRFLLTFLLFGSLLLTTSVAQSNNWKAPVSAKKIKNPLAKVVSASKKGKLLFKTNCVVCHGDKGKGNGVAAVALNPKPADLSSDRVKKETDGEIFWKITNGKAAMPAWKGTLKTEQRWQLVNYIRTLQKQKK